MTDSSREMAVVAAASILEPVDFTSVSPLLPYETWQHEAWTYLDTIGELSYAVRWRAQSLSRMRLVAAQIEPGTPEPVPLDSGPVYDMVANWGGGITRQPALIKTLAVNMDVVGEAYHIVEEDEDSGVERTAVYSTSEIRPSRLSESRRSRRDRERRGVPRAKFDVQVGPNMWRALGGESLVGRIWDADDQFHWMATSPVKSAIPVLREIDMLNRYIIATLLSRLAMNGLLLFPQEMTVSVPQQFKDAPDGFYRWLVDVASKAIKNPGTASAAIPIPLKVPREFIDAIRHLEFANAIDKEVFSKRDAAVERLARTLNVPQEVITGVGDVNHWGQWQIGEDAIKINLAPTMETIVDGVTSVWLWPLLGGNGVDAPSGGRFVIWYDATELTTKPDLSKTAIELRKIHEISGEALRRETGFSEDDMPDDIELRRQILIDQTKMPDPLASAALAELTGGEPLVEEAPPPEPGAGAPSDDDLPAVDDNAPASPSNAPPEPAASSAGTQNATSVVDNGAHLVSA